MKYYSELTKEFYDDEKACAEAENKIAIEQAKEKERKEQLASERKARAAEVEEARKAMSVAQHNYRKLLEAFCRDYKSYHYSTTTEDIPTLFDLISWL